MLRRIYDWCVAAAYKPVRDLDPGHRLVRRELVLSDPARRDADPDVAGAAGAGLFLRIALHLTSVAGGILGYAIGSLLYDSVGQWLIALYGYGDKVDAFREAYAEYGAWIILLKGLTPIPYKIVTITSGFAGYNSAVHPVCRSSRAACASTCWRSCCTATASRARQIIEERLGFWVTIVAIVVLVVGIVAAVYLF